MRTSAAVLDSPQTQHHSTSRRFALFRQESEHAVAEGLIFPNGKVVLQWLHRGASAAFFNSLDELLEIHGQGANVVLEC